MGALEKPGCTHALQNMVAPTGVWRDKTVRRPFGEFAWGQLTEAEEIKKRQQECTEELYKKYLNDPDNHDGAITHLEPEIL